MKVCGHDVERVYDSRTLSYRCTDCGLQGTAVHEFDQYTCPPR